MIADYKTRVVSPVLLFDNCPDQNPLTAHDNLFNLCIKYGRVLAVPSLFHKVHTFKIQMIPGNTKAQFLVQMLDSNGAESALASLNGMPTLSGGKISVVPT